jgi:Protein of unknown function (DUF3592)
MFEGLACGSIFFGLIAVAFAVLLVRKLLESRRVKHWPVTGGKVIASDVVARPREMRDASDPAFVNEANVEYEYLVGNIKYRCKRISLAEKISGSEIEVVLARYPVGATVAVFYDPANPNNALLERDLSKVVVITGIGCLLSIILVPSIAAAIYFNGVDWLKSHIDNPSRAPFVMAAGAFGLVTGLFALVCTVIVLHSRRWPTTPGRIIAAGTEQFKDREPDSGGSRTLYKSFVQYTYEVNGHQYTGDRVSLGVTISSTIPALARRQAAKFQPGAEVTVYYNPLDPTDCCLNPRSWWFLLIWAVCIAMLALAWAVATGRM